MNNSSLELILRIGIRLTVERQRLNFTQKHVYNALGLGAATLSRYENGHAAPDMLQAHAFAALGYDMHYVLTGQRIGESASDLTENERTWLELYRQANDPKMLMRLVRAFIAAE
ncbi:helix-turn-helix domain-containing protein [Psychrobacter urativorans]|uniref:HTH cro/C1-type domain-containing protein n=1 Tax=Psychrobacter urativorans TaxID=45610 RepID=A0A0M4T3E8_9GAMM|nr:helix-turn-helix transcriptional regulator [Psychrobacter urativorans]ALF60302.1 hypothetical protein AOC03_09855 [Psychrobacter urativorans]